MDDDHGIVEDAEAILKDATPEQTMTMASTYAPPSTTVIRTQYDGWYYVDMTFDEAINVIETAMRDSGDRTFVIFNKVVGNEATRVCLDLATITAIIDLTPAAIND